MYCSNCGVEFETKDKRVRHCPKCREAMKNKNKNKTCVICGVELAGIARKYCTTCRKDVKRKQIQDAMSKKHQLLINKDIYNNFLMYFPKPTKEIEQLMLSRIEEVCKH